MVGANQSLGAAPAENVYLFTPEQVIRVSCLKYTDMMDHYYSLRTKEDFSNAVSLL